MTDTGENVHVWSFLALDSEVDDEVNQTLPLVGVSFVLMVVVLGVFFQGLARHFSSCGGSWSLDGLDVRDAGLARVPGDADLFHAAHLIARPWCGLLFSWVAPLANAGS